MTAVATVTAMPVEARRRTVAGALGGAEAWRIVRHPVTLAGLALFILVNGAVGGDDAVGAFDMPTTGTTYFLGVFTYFAANLVTTRDRRSGGEEMLAPLPADRLTRTVATVLAALGPAVLAVVVVVLVVGAYELLGFFDVRPGFWHLAQAPVSVFGGALLGIMVGRWAPYPGVALLVMVAMVAWNVAASNTENWGPVGTYTSWARYTDNGSWGGYYPGSPFWHVLYLVALCAMAAVGTVLRDVRNRLPWLAAGALLTLSALLAGWAALP